MFLKRSNNRRTTMRNHMDFCACAVSTELLLMFPFQYLQSFWHGKISFELSKELAKLQNVVLLLNRNLGEVPCCSAEPEVITSNPSGSICSSGDKSTDWFVCLLIILLFYLLIQGRGGLIALFKISFCFWNSWWEWTFSTSSSCSPESFHYC